MQVAVMIHRMLWKKGVLSRAAMHASCCHDPQNALVEEGVHARMQVAAVVIHRMLW
jgi:hypothetical protein